MIPIIPILLIVTTTASSFVSSQRNFSELLEVIQTNITTTTENPLDNSTKIYPKQRSQSRYEIRELYKDLLSATKSQDSENLIEDYSGEEVYDDDYYYYSSSSEEERGFDSYETQAKSIALRKFPSLTRLIGDEDDFFTSDKRFASRSRGRSRRKRSTIGFPRHHKTDHVGYKPPHYMEGVDFTLETVFGLPMSKYYVSKYGVHSPMDVMPHHKGPVLHSATSDYHSLKPDYHAPKKPDYHKPEPEYHALKKPQYLELKEPTHNDPEYQAPQAPKYHEPEPEYHAPKAPKYKEPEPEYHSPKTPKYKEPEPAYRSQVKPKYKEPEHHEPEYDLPFKSRLVIPSRRRVPHFDDDYDRKPSYYEPIYYSSKSEEEPVYRSKSKLEKAHSSSRENGYAIYYLPYDQYVLEYPEHGLTPRIPTLPGNAHFLVPSPHRPPSIRGRRRKRSPENNNNKLFSNRFSRVSTKINSKNVRNFLKKLTTSLIPKSRKNAAKSANKLNSNNVLNRNKSKNRFPSCSHSPSPCIVTDNSFPPLLSFSPQPIHSPEVESRNEQRTTILLTPTIISSSFPGNKFVANTGETRVYTFSDNNSPSPSSYKINSPNNIFRPGSSFPSNNNGGQVGNFASGSDQFVNHKAPTSNFILKNNSFKSQSGNNQFFRNSNQYSSDVITNSENLILSNKHPLSSSSVSNDNYLPSYLGNPLKVNNKLNGAIYVSQNSPGTRGNIITYPNYVNPTSEHSSSSQFTSSSYVRPSSSKSLSPTLRSNYNPFLQTPKPIVTSVIQITTTTLPPSTTISSEDLKARTSRITAPEGATMLDVLATIDSDRINFAKRALKDLSSKELRSVLEGVELEDPSADVIQGEWVLRRRKKTNTKVNDEEDADGSFRIPRRNKVFGLIGDQEDPSEENIRRAIERSPLGKQIRKLKNISLNIDRVVKETENLIRKRGSLSLVDIRLLRALKRKEKRIDQMIELLSKRNGNGKGDVDVERVINILEQLGIEHPSGKPWSSDLIRSIFKIPSKEKSEDADIDTTTKKKINDKIELPRIPKISNDALEIDSRKTALLRASEKQQLIISNLSDAIRRQINRKNENLTISNDMSQFEVVETFLNEQTGVLESFKTAVSSLNKNSSTEERLRYLEDASHRQLDILEFLLDTITEMETHSAESLKRINNIEIILEAKNMTRAIGRDEKDQRTSDSSSRLTLIPKKSLKDPSDRAGNWYNRFVDNYRMRLLQNKIQQLSKKTTK